MPSPPPLLGFAEAVSEVPPVEDFLPPPQPPPPLPSPGSSPSHAELAAMAAPEAEPPHDPGPPPGTTPVRARVRDLPSGPAQPAPAMQRPQNLVGRLGRGRGEAFASRPPSPVDEVGTAEQELAMAGPPSVDRAAERGGRPSLPRNRRLYRRAKLPAEIEIGGTPCTLIDVSIGGFAASGVPQLEPNALVPVTLRLTIDGIEVGTSLKARIIYVTQGRSSGRFVELSASQMAFLRYIVTWRGESVGAVGTTTLLDAISTSERGFAAGAAMAHDMDAKSRWWAGLIGKKVNPPR